VVGVRKIKLRSAMTMSPDRNGIFDVLLGLVRRGMGGQSGDGRQFVSWVHYEDFIRAAYWLIDHPGEVNLLELTDFFDDRVYNNMDNVTISESTNEGEI